jgi:hypothetical protein
MTSSFESFEQPQLSLAELPPLAFRISFQFALARSHPLASSTRPFFSHDEEVLSGCSARFTSASRRSASHCSLFLLRSSGSTGRLCPDFP